MTKEVSWCFCRVFEEEVELSGSAEVEVKLHPVSVDCMATTEAIAIIPLLIKLPKFSLLNFLNNPNFG